MYFYIHLQTSPINFETGEGSPNLIIFFLQLCSTHYVLLGCEESSVMSAGPTASKPDKDVKPLFYCSLVVVVFKRREKGNIIPACD